MQASGWAGMNSGRSLKTCLAGRTNLGNCISTLKSVLYYQTSPAVCWVDRYSICNKTTLLFCHYRRSLGALYNSNCSSWIQCRTHHPNHHHQPHPLHLLVYYGDELHCLRSSLLICLYIPVKTLCDLDS